MRQWAVFVEGALDVKDALRAVADVPMKQVMALNTTVTRFRTVGARAILDEVAFPSQYLNPSAKRLYVAQKATKAKREGIIRARGRPTSLARFVTKRNPGKEGVSVQVEPGRTQELPRAFMVKLRAGAASIDTQFNLGLAIRLGKGKTMRGKRNAIRLDSGLYLLYGPSVDQVFINATGANAGKGVATEMTPDMLDFMEAEFLRLLDLDL